MIKSNRKVRLRRQEKKTQIVNRKKRSFFPITNFSSFQNNDRLRIHFSISTKKMLMFNHSGYFYIEKMLLKLKSNDENKTFIELRHRNTEYRDENKGLKVCDQSDIVSCVAACTMIFSGAQFIIFKFTKKTKCITLQLRRILYYTTRGQ